VLIKSTTEGVKMGAAISYLKRWSTFACWYGIISKDLNRQVIM